MDASHSVSPSIHAVRRTELFDSWVLWAHLPHDTDWTLGSYKKIMKISTIEEMIMLYRMLPEKMIKNCMLFLMREGITPMWEDKKNRKGGCFSYKISNKTIFKVWKLTSYNLVGETLWKGNSITKHINGITISPKKSFCIVKIWMDTCEFQNADKINSNNGLSPHGCIFKRHKVEY